MKKSYTQLLLILTLFLILATAYSFVVPVFNAPDEPFHFEYIHFLARNGRLPDQTSEDHAISTEGFNPPMYYLLNAPFLHLLSRDNAADIRIHSHQDIVNFFQNPYRGFRDDIFPPLNPHYIKWRRGSERNMFLTTPEDRFPFSGSIRVIHLLRIISVLLGAMTILFIYKTAHLLLPESQWFAALTAALCAFNPQFNFLSGSLTNDNLVILFSTVSIFLLTRLILAEQGIQRGTVALLGTSIGMGLISKVNISGVVLMAMIGIIYRALTTKGQRIRNLLISLLLFLGPIVCIAGWFFVRNISIYGLSDPFGWHLQAIQNPGLVLPAQWRGMFFRRIFFQRLFTSFWGQFDWLTILLPVWAYVIYGIVSLTAIWGFLAFLLGRNLRRGTKTCILLYLGIILVSLANLIYLNFTFESSQSRLLFPAMTGFCILMALGIAFLLWRLSCFIKIKMPLVIAAFILFLMGLDIYTLFRIIYPIYR